MFKRTLRLFSEIKGNTSSPLVNKHKKILEYFTPNDNIVDKLDQIPFELRGEYSPRRKVNPYKKRPLNVIYDIKDYTSYVLPSRREKIFSLWGIEELFGVKRWRNDSPFIKEYIKVDNQIFFIVILSLVLAFPIFWSRQRKLERNLDNYITSGYGKFTSDDLI
jgi:hypothetical protein